MKSVKNVKSVKSLFKILKFSNEYKKFLRSNDLEQFFENLERKGKDRDRREAEPKNSKDYDHGHDKKLTKIMEKKNNNKN